MTRLFDAGGAWLQATDVGLSVGGDVDFEVAAALAAAGVKWLGQQPSERRVRFDLTGVERVSSSALSVMLEWMRSAHRAGLEVEAVALSPALARLTALAGLDALLPLAPPDEASGGA